MKRAILCALLIVSGLILFNGGSCSGGGSTTASGFIVSTTEEILSGLVPIGPFAVSIVYQGSWSADVVGATVTGTDTFVSGVTNSAGLATEPNGRVPAIWRFLEVDGDCAGMTTGAFSIARGGTAPLMCVIISPVVSITPSVYDVSTSASTAFVLTTAVGGDIGSATPSVYVTDQFGQVVTNAIVNGVYSEAGQTTAYVSIPGVASLYSGTYFVWVSANGSSGAAPLSVVGNDPPPPPPPDGDPCSLGVCQVN